METVGVVILLVVVAVLIVLMVKAAKAAPGIFEEYEGVFGRGTVNTLMMSVYCVLALIGYIVMIIVNGDIKEIPIPYLLGIVVGIIVFIAVAVLLVLRAKSKCPDELLPRLHKSLLIASFGAFGQYCRWSWNLVCTVWSCIPGFGWMANFIITKDKEMKEKMVQEGAKADAETEARWKRERAEKEAREAEEAARIKQEQDDVRRKAWKEDGRTDVQFNRDSSKWKYQDEDWTDARNVKRR